MIISWDRSSARVTNDSRDLLVNQKPVLLLHCNGTDAATSFPDSSPSNHTVTANGNAQVDTAQSKWGGASALFDGTGDYLSIPDSIDWDISTDFTIDLWVKHDDHVGTENYIRQVEPGGNHDRWALSHYHGNGIRFYVRDEGDFILNIDYGGEITDTDWHHVAMCKVGNEYGIYKDGTQVAHTSDADTATFTGSLYIGGDGVHNDYYFDGHLDEIRIVKSNPFGAAPVVGLTDKIIVPTRPYISWR